MGRQDNVEIFEDKKNLQAPVNITPCKATACVIYCFNGCSSLIRLIRLINCRKITGKLSTHSYEPCSVSA